MLCVTLEVTSLTLKMSSTPSSLKQCQICHAVLPSLKFLLKHVRQVHAHKPGFNITCCLSGCTRVFRTFEVFRNHVYDIHSEAEAVVLQDACRSEIGDALDDGDPSMTGEDNHEPFSHNARKIATATWILKVQETYKLPQSTMELILKDITGFVQDMLVDLYEDVCTTLSNAGIDCTAVAGLSSLFGSDSAFATPFAGLESNHCQMKFYKESLGLVVSSHTLHALYFIVYTYF